MSSATRPGSSSSGAYSKHFSTTLLRQSHSDTETRERVQPREFVLAKLEHATFDLFDDGGPVLGATVLQDMLSHIISCSGHTGSGNMSYCQDFKEGGAASPNWSSTRSGVWSTISFSMGAWANGSATGEIERGGWAPFVQGCSARVFAGSRGTLQNKSKKNYVGKTNKNGNKRISGTIRVCG